MTHRDPLSVTFTQMITDILDHRGWTQAELAEMVGDELAAAPVTQSTVSRWSNGMEPSGREALAIAKLWQHLDVPLVASVEKVQSRPLAPVTDPASDMAHFEDGGLSRFCLFARRKGHCRHLYWFGPACACREETYRQMKSAGGSPAK